MKRKKKRRKKIVISLFFLGAVIVAALAALYQSRRSLPRPKAEEYFEISDFTWDGFIEGNGSLLILNILTFNLTAVGGDAHQVRIPNLGLKEATEWWWEPYVDLGTMSQGEVETVQLTSEKGVYIHLKEEGFPVQVRIISKEISKKSIDQFITIYATQEDQVKK